MVRDLWATLQSWEEVMVILILEVGGEHPSIQSGKGVPTNFDVNRISMNLARNEIWKMKDVIQGKMVDAAKFRIEANGQNNGLSPASMFNLLPEDKQTPNVAIFQHSLSAPFTIEYAYVSNGPKRLKESNLADNYFGKSLTKILEKSESSFDEKFEKVFTLQERGYNKKEIAFGQMLLGNMLGGIGYFHGTSIEDHARIDFDEEEIFEAEDVVEEDDDYFGESEGAGQSRDIPPPNPQPAGPFSLFTGVPSRPFFPRGIESFYCRILVGFRI
jgi:mannosyl-oligosaccharide glucosidase